MRLGFWREKERGLLGDGFKHRDRDQGLMVRGLEGFSERYGQICG